jgi:hypothetical protein
LPGIDNLALSPDARPAHIFAACHRVLESESGRLLPRKHHFGPHSRSYCTGGALLAMDAKGAQMTYLKRSRVRLLEVTVTAQRPTLWK